MTLSEIGPTTGKLVDIAADLLGWIAVYQDGDWLVIVQLTPEGERRVPDVRVPCGGGNAFPRLFVDWRRHTWLAYRHDQVGGILIDLTAARDWTLGWVYGNDPICFGGSWVAWQATPTYDVRVAHLLEPGVSALLRTGAPTGLAYVEPDATVVQTVDEVRATVPGLVNPRRAGRCTVGENAAGPLRTIARLDDGREATIWPGHISYTPRIATDGGTYAVVTWGGPGVRLALLTDQDFRTPPPPPEPKPDIPFQVEPDRVIPNLWEWICAGATAVVDLGPDEQIAYFLKSHEGHAEWWHRRGNVIGHLEDQSTGHRLWADAPREEWRSLSPEEYLALRDQGVSVPAWSTLPLDGYYFADGARYWAPAFDVRNGLAPVRVDSVITYRNGRTGPFYWVSSVRVGFGRYDGREYYAEITYDVRRPDAANPRRQKGGLEKFLIGPQGWTRWERYKDDEHGVPQLMQVTTGISLQGPYVEPQRPKPYGAIWTPPAPPKPKEPTDMPYIPPARDHLLDVITWLREQVYPGIVGHPLNDEGIAAWVCDAYITYRQQGIGHEDAKHRVFADIEAVVRARTT